MESESSPDRRCTPLSHGAPPSAHLRFREGHSSAIAPSTFLETRLLGHCIGSQQLLQRVVGATETGDRLQACRNTGQLTERDLSLFVPRATGITAECSQA